LGFWKNSLPDGSDKIFLLGRLFSFLKRMMPGEEKNRPLWQDIKLFFGFLDSGTHKGKIPPLFEIGFVLRALNNLGYVSSFGEKGDFKNLKEGELKFFLESKTIDENFFRKVESKKSALIPLINRAIKESHL